MNEPLVSIIIPAYNCEKYIAETLGSVLAQTYSNWECVIIDDGSTDNTPSIIKEYIHKYSRISYHYQENQGPSVARNNAILHSSGEFILPLDADDLIASTYLEKAINHFQAFPSTKLVYCRAEMFGDINGEWILPKYNYHSFIWNNCIFCTAMYKRTDYDATSGYNPNMVHGLEDWDFWLSLLRENDIVHRIDEILFRYRIRKGSRNNTFLQNYSEDALIQVYKNHRDTYEPFMPDYQSRIILNMNLASELNSQEEELVRIQTTKAYRVGKIILEPLSWLKSKLQK